MKMGRHQVPSFWKKMLPPDFQWLRFPDEKLSTCKDCYQVAIGEFTKGCQCCTYYPEIPNFMLGFALRDSTSRPYVESLIADGHGLPIGLLPTPSTMLRAIRAYALGRFGQEPTMVCPFMDPTTTDCRVYGYRNSVCSTFFCSNDHGKDGMEFWGKVQDLVGRVESTLAQWVLDAIGFGSRVYMSRLDGWATRLDQAESDGAWSDAARDELWGEWRGREIGFYEECAYLVESFSGSLFEAASAQEFVEPLAYQRAVRQQVPDVYADAAPRVADTDHVWPHIEDLWYKVELEHRRLWALPIGEGAVSLAHDLCVEELEPARLPIAGSLRWRARWAEEEILLSEAEATALLLFAETRPIDERLFAEPDIQALPDARASLAQWLRVGALVSNTPK